MEQAQSKNLYETDWNQELQEGDTATRKDGGDSVDVVLLAGLQRLARQAGLVRQECVIQTPAPTMVQAIFTVTFTHGDREVQFVGTADCNSKNTQGKFVHYPTAVAESRAEARALRKALGIRMLSSEEIGFREGASALEAAPGRKAASNTVAAIEMMCREQNMEPIHLLEEVLDEQRASSIFELSELTTDEAQRAMKYLNSSTTKAAKSGRSARKAELEQRQSR